MALRDLRQDLQRRPDVAPADVDDVLAIAARRQDEAHKAAEGATREEIAAVAAELDIAPEHVDAAIAELKATRAEAARVAENTRVATRALVATVAGAIALTAVAGGLVGGGSVYLGAGRVDAAAEAAHAAEARLDAALERQASLTPALAALAGTPDPELARLAAAVRDAADVEARLDAADALTTAMATQLGKLPPATSDADATLRLQLHDDVTGSQNRVTVELRRYREALSTWEAAASDGAGSWAVTFGLAEAPP